MVNDYSFGPILRNLGIMFLGLVLSSLIFAQYLKAQQSAHFNVPVSSSAK